MPGHLSGRRLKTMSKVVLPNKPRYTGHRELEKRLSVYPRVAAALRCHAPFAYALKIRTHTRMFCRHHTMLGEFVMQVLLLASFSFAIALATAQPSSAQSSSPEEAAARATMQSQTPGGTWAVIEAQVKNTLEEAGFKNIQVMPSSFVVQAEKDGQPLTLVIHSDGKTVSYLAVPPAK